MSRCGYEMRGLSTISVSDSVVCPKPRRIALNDHFRPSSWHLNCQTEISDAKARTELLDIILTKGSYTAEKPNNQVASSPPYFSGSPPSRALNPLIQDSQFGNYECSPLSQHSHVLAASPSSSARKGGLCAWAKLGQKPAAVRIEGFDCLSRDRKSIPAVA
ncbi:uncharacterized protein LOC130767120 [Actinidia eriantha]|uniref:uncharacterized protein LOC130767120 n=1 Tax=Actinidia eriantha TaxID=165200 RepID=UPI002587DE6C|nr:uncharacterized protein LOC130767120 [Actinidia eriantha]